MARPIHAFVLLLVVETVAVRVEIRVSGAVHDRRKASFFSSGRQRYVQMVSERQANIALANMTLSETSLGQHVVPRRVGESAVNAARPNMPFSKTSLGQHVVPRKVGKETANAALTNMPLSKTSLGQHAVIRKVAEETGNVTRTKMLLFIVICIVPCMVIFRYLGAPIASRFFFNNATDSPCHSRRVTNALTADIDTESDNSDLEWCHPDAVAMNGSLTSDIEVIAPSWNVKSLNDVLQTHGLNMGHVHGSVYKWTEEQLVHFAMELSESKARLAREDKSLLRVVDMLIVHVVYKQDGLVLQEFARPDFTGVADEDAFIKCTLKSRFRSSEGFMECAERCLQKLGTDVARCLEVVPDILEMREERRILHSAHPGLPTLMQYYVVEARALATDQDDLEDLGLLSMTLRVDGYIYKWDQLDNVPHAKKHLKKSRGASNQGPVLWKGVTHSFLPVLPWTEYAVLEELRNRGFPNRSFISPDAMKTLLRALNGGHVSLALRKGSPPRLACVREKISVAVRSQRKIQILVTGFSKDGVPILPNIERQASESSWRAAVRLCQANLKLSAPLFQMEGRLLAVSDEFKDQKDWEEVTRVHILSGPLIDGCFAHT